ncbi:ester cyclase [Pseudokineococcus basanitobsidens]|uniref:Ester cyclase n=2 Tax=Pseudokineococcus basanitobsidens TaxID=1926649 RepID=A0ABU8RMF5_9ACTN
MSRDSVMAAQQAFGDAVNSGDLAAFERLVAVDSVDHDPAPGQEAGPVGFEHFFTELRTAFPDLAIAVDHLVATDDEVAFAYTVTGTHQGELMGFAPTGRSVSFRGMQISRFEGDRLVERWGSSDQMGMLAQLGIEPRQDSAAQDG